MSYNPDKHHRRSIRLKGYDYTQPGAYYITLCTKARQCLFGDVVAGKMRLNSFLIWQRNFYEHINRDEKSLETIRRYIKENPGRWAEDPENPQHYPKNQNILIDLPF
ncbi:hypothetical protein [Coleofasciculus sp. F4-SAH-05]|uniref:hypothetical protein n=1 Tax=Coleofasciculus sp. F4-SAH-05 TaxID=3069525 RepID=UPI0032FA13A8